MASEMSRRSPQFALTTLALLLFSGNATQANQENYSEQTISRVNLQDRRNMDAPAEPEAAAPGHRESELVGTIHMTNQMEIRAGHLAKAKGTTPEIRRYGDRLVRDHLIADRQLMKLAQDEKIPILEPSVQTAQDEQQRLMMERLEQANGPEFDQAFVLMMSSGHHQTVANLKLARNNLPAMSRLRMHLNRLIPILDQHHQIAAHIERKAHPAEG